MAESRTGERVQLPCHPNDDVVLVIGDLEGQLGDGPKTSQWILLPARVAASSSLLNRPGQKPSGIRPPLHHMGGGYSRQDGTFASAPEPTRHRCRAVTPKGVAS